MEWKRFAVGQAELAARGLEDPCMHCCVAQQLCLLSRISGNMEHAVSSIDCFVEGRSEIAKDKRMHSAIGNATLQCSLNFIQVEDLAAAMDVLENWRPLDQDLSSME